MAPDDYAPEEIARLARAQHRARVRAKARGQYSDDAVMQAVSQQLLERLPLLLIEPKQLLDLGCRHGEQFEALKKLYPDCEMSGVSLEKFGLDGNEQAQSRGWLNRIASFGQKKPAQIIPADPHSLPFDDGCFDLVVSNLCLPFCQNPRQVFSEVARVLKPGGAFLFSSLGPDTLLEYRQRWAQLDSYPHISGLIDMHDLGDAMLNAGLADPVLDRDSLQLDYPSVAALEAELQVFGLVNMACGRRKGLISPRQARQLHDSTSEFSVGLELVHGHAWKAEFSPKRHSSNEEYKIPVSELQGSWKR